MSYVGWTTLLLPHEMMDGCSNKLSCACQPLEIYNNSVQQILLKNNAYLGYITTGLRTDSKNHEMSHDIRIK